LRLAQEHRPSAPFIVVTGSINEETAVGCMKAGAADYLLKSSLARIGPAVHAALERGRARREQAEAEAALRRSEANLRAIFDSSREHLICVDRAGRVLTFNASAARWVTGFAGAELREGRPIADYLPEQLADDCRVLLDSALAGEARTIERQVPRGSGGPRWYEIAVTPVTDAAAVLGVCVGITDIEERKHAADHYLRAERMEAVGRLAGGVAHEVNNMMTVIQGFGTFLMHGLPGADPRRDEVAEILRAADRAASVTRQLLAFSRQQLLQPTLLDLSGVVQGVDGMLRRLLGDTHTLEIRTAPSLGRVHADRAQLEQVLVNLALNARDAMPAGGRLTIETSPVMLDESYVRRRTGVQIRPGPYIMLAVSDTGSGMDATTLARAFEPFFTTKPVGQGTGLGLSTVYGIVKQSGGYVWPYSEPGLGTTFKVYLPLAGSDEHRESVADNGGAAPSRGNEIVLVVEDEDVVRHLASRTLGSLGYTVLEARHGGEALQVLSRRDSGVQLVLSDVVMPGIGGRELGESVANAHPGLPILYMSGYTGEDVVQRGLLAPGAPFLPKPFTPDALGRKVREMLDHRHAHHGDNA
ncbi:MAG: response regulator, partial [Gemmatimonadota bacterium]|nr:response regulator [Gemmatimonadota bacterium]